MVRDFSYLYPECRELVEIGPRRMVIGHVRVLVETRAVEADGESLIGAVGKGDSVVVE